MRVQLKKLKINSQLSQETTCFTAILVLDGVEAGQISNRGNGGPCEVRIPDHALFDRFNEFCISQSPEPNPLLPGIAPLPMDMDGYLSRLVMKGYELRQIKKANNKRTYFRLKDKEYGDGVWSMLEVGYSPDVKRQLQQRFGNLLGEIANESANELLL